MVFSFSASQALFVVAVSLDLHLDLVLAEPGRNGQIMFCQFDNRAQYLAPPGKFTIRDVNADFCTHLLVGFWDINPQTQEIFIDGRSHETEYVLHELKEEHPLLKLHITMGRPGDQNKMFDQIFLTESTTKAFADHRVVPLLRRGYDGFNIYWHGIDSLNLLTRLCSYLSDAFKRANVDASKRRWMLSLTITWYPSDSIDPWNHRRIHDLQWYVDYLIVKAFDTSMDRQPIVSHTTPLAMRPSDKNGDPELAKFDLSSAMTWWEVLGMPRYKLLMGAPIYARWLWVANTEVSPNNSDYNVTLLPYYRVEQLFSDSPDSWEQTFDIYWRAPFARRDQEEITQWVFYHNILSVIDMCRWTANHHYLGAVLWSLHYDDFQFNVTGDGYMPLTRGLDLCLKSTRWIRRHTRGDDKPIRVRLSPKGYATLGLLWLVFMWMVFFALII